MSRRFDSMSILGLALAAGCALAFVDWLVFARGLPVPRGAYSMLDFGSWLARRGDSSGLTHALRLVLAVGGIASSGFTALIFLRATENVARGRSRGRSWATRHSRSPLTSSRSTRAIRRDRHSDTRATRSRPRFSSSWR